MPSKKSDARKPSRRLGKPKVFVSYAHQDSAIVEKLVTDLEHRGAEVLVDVKRIRVGDSISSYVEKSISVSRFVCLVLSSNSIKRPWVQAEYRAALTKQLGNRNRSQILPIRLDDVKMPVLLRDIMYADFSSGYHTGLRRLVQAINLRELESPLLNIVGKCEELVDPNKVDGVYLETPYTNHWPSEFQRVFEKAMAATLKELDAVDFARISFVEGVSNIRRHPIEVLLSDPVQLRARIVGESQSDATWGEPHFEHEFVGLNAFVPLLRQFRAAINQQGLYILPKAIYLSDMGRRSNYFNYYETIDIRQFLRRSKS